MSFVNPLATADQLWRLREFSSLPTDLLHTIFFATQCLTQAAGHLLRLPQSATAQANVVLARYWLVEPPMAHEFSEASAAAIYLVAKVGPSPRSPRDVANVYAYLLSPRSTLFRGKAATPGGDDARDAGDTGDTGNAGDDDPDPSAHYQSESEYHAFHGRVLALEGRILRALGFDTHVALPHPLAVTYLQALGFLGRPAGDRAGRERLARRAAAHLNAALLSPQLLYLTHQPHALAAAAVYAAARDVRAKMPECGWWEVFDVDREELGFLVVGMRSLEGWVRSQRDAFEPLREGMVTRATIRREMEKRGLHVGNGGGAADEEDEMMRQLDERSMEMDTAP